MLLREPAIRTLRCLGAGVIKSFEFFASESACSLFERTDPSLLDLELDRADPMRTTRGAGLPEDRSWGDSRRGDERRLS